MSKINNILEEFKEALEAESDLAHDDIRDEDFYGVAKKYIIKDNESGWLDGYSDGFSASEDIKSDK